MATIRENLLALIDAVEKEPEQQFDLHVFESACGTLHCTLGLAATLPYFRNLGLNMFQTGLGVVTSAVVTINGLRTYDPGAYEYLDRLFGEASYERLFEPADEGVWDEDLQSEVLIDKELAIARLRRQLELYP